MFSKAALPSLLLIASANGAVLPRKRTLESEILRVRDGLGDLLSGIESLAGDIVQALPTEISDPLESLIGGMIDPTGGIAFPTPTDDLDPLITPAPVEGGDVLPSSISSDTSFTGPVDFGDPFFTVVDFSTDSSGSLTVISVLGPGPTNAPVTAAPAATGVVSLPGAPLSPVPSNPNIPPALSIPGFGPVPTTVALPGTPLMVAPPLGLTPTTPSRRSRAHLAKRESVQQQIQNGDGTVGAIEKAILGILPSNIASGASSLINHLAGGQPTATATATLSSASSTATLLADNNSAKPKQSNAARALQAGAGSFTLVGPAIFVASIFMGVFVVL